MADDKTVVVDSGGGSGGAIAVIVGIIAILAILYVVFGTNLLNKAPDKIDANIKIEQPK